MKKFILNNKSFLISVVVLILFSTVYYFSKVSNFDNSLDGKEIVYIILRNGEIKKGLPDLVEKFNEENDEIYIDLQLYDADYDNIITTKLANENEIDIFQYNGKTLIEKNFILPLNKMNIDFSILPEDVLFKYNNDVIGIKYGSSMPKIMYNDWILEKAGINPDQKPNTLDEFITILEKVKQNVPDVIPFNLSIANIHDLWSLLGNMAASEDSIYPTFWNYKTGEYDYDALKPILERFKYMYENELININFDEKSDEDIFNDFRNEKAATTYTISYKKYTVVDRTFDLKTSFGDIPQLSKVDNKRYYYTNQRILCIANNVKDKEKLNDDELRDVQKHEAAVKRVYEWLINQDTVNSLTKKDSNYATFGDNPFTGELVYDSINFDKGFNQSKYDPTEILAGNSQIIKNNIFSTIKENKDINTEVNKLTEEMNKFITSNKRNEEVDFNEYRE